MAKKHILIIFGTRPEAIKLVPIILELQKHKTLFKLTICNTEQQKQLSNEVLISFGIKADVNLDIMQENQALHDLNARLLQNLQAVFQSNSIDATIVQGDTMSAFVGALTSFYNKIPIFHIEAGLRSYNNFEPFPEEALRAMISKLATLHFAPTKMAALALKKEGINHNVYKVGNTSIDSIKLYIDRLDSKKALSYIKECAIKAYDYSEFEKNLVLVTIHRRENHMERLEAIVEAIAILAKSFSSHHFIVPIHPNPNVKQVVTNALQKHNNIILTTPLPYSALLYIMSHAKLIITDSGGLQEEAPSFKAPILVTRYKTERMEAVKAGFSKLVGANRDKIIAQATKILKKPKSATRIHAKNPYGNGKASEKIVNIIKEWFEK